MHNTQVSATLLALKENKEIDEGLIKGAINFAQGVADVASGVMSFIPGLNLVGSAIDAVSAGVDVLQGEKEDAAWRAASAGAGLIPGAGALVKGGKLAKAAAGAGKAISKMGKGMQTAGKTTSGFKGALLRGGGEIARYGAVATRRAGRAAQQTLDKAYAASGKSNLGVGRLASAGSATQKGFSTLGSKIGGKTGQFLTRTGSRIGSAAKTGQTAINVYRGTLGKANFGTRDQPNQTIGEGMSYLEKVKNTVQNMKPDTSVIHQQVDQKANKGDQAKSILVKEPFKAMKPKLFGKTSFNPKNVGSEGY